MKHYDNLLCLKGRIVLFIPIGLISLNIKLFDIMGMSIKPIHFIALALIINTFSYKMYSSDIVKFLITLLIPILGLINIINFMEFIYSYLIYIMGAFLLIVSHKYFLSISDNNIKKTFKLLFKLYNITAIYGIIQFILANIFNNEMLYNNLGRFQFHPHLDNMMFGIIRATSIYIEPSVLAWVSTTVFVLAYYLRNSDIIKPSLLKYTMLLCSINILISLSSAGLLSFFFLIITILLIKNKKYYIFLFFMFLICLLMLLMNFNIFKYFRINEIFIMNTSGYIRIIEPFKLMIEVLKRYTFTGRGIGQIGLYDPNLYTNIYIHNSLYGIIITFGLTSLYYFIPGIKIIFKYFKKDKETIFLFINIVFILLTTGGFLTLEFPFIILLYILAISHKMIEK